MTDEIKIDLKPVLTKIGIFVQEEAVRMCPIDQGDLRKSIKYEVQGDSVIIFSDSPYAEDMEYGTPPEPLSKSEKDDIKDWARRHKIKNPVGTVKYIEKYGIKVGTPEKPLHIRGQGRDSYRPFLRPAAYKNIPKIKQIIKESFK